MAEAPAPNRPVPEAIDQVWTGDITYIPSQTGWLYLAFVMDLCSRRIIGWSLASHMRADLVVSALDQALQTRDPNPETIFRSDLGSQYGSHALRDRLGAADIQQSMSARANPYDNAFTESFIGTLKAELIEGTDFTGEQDARLEVFDYIEGYYNTQRSHSSLGCRSPSAFERALHE